MQEIFAKDAQIQDAFWSGRLEINAHKAIFHQWQMLEVSGCINNFRIAAGEKNGLREGWFFADSDATKWLDAAARIERNGHDERLTRLMNELIRLLGKAQSPDGYLFTYNQIHFPGQRWVNLQIEHELYCHGHLIEAGVSHFEATGKEKMLIIAQRAADLLVRDFLHAGAAMTPGHEEIEIALLRLWQTTSQDRYHDLAVHFLEQRGRSRFFGLSVAQQFISNGRREAQTKKAHADSLITQGLSSETRIPANNQAIKPPFSEVRFFASALSGAYFQQRHPIRRLTKPVGHSVRFGYLETALAMELHQSPDGEIFAAMQSAWEQMVAKRMDVTGGLGALPDLEGFGRDYELNPETTYNETCAAIASLMWNRQLASLTQEAKYSDLYEWQLYNAVLVGMGWQGDRYLYNNPTLARGGISRQPWFAIPCCPSNLSRTFADLGKNIFSYDEENLWVHQYIGSVSPVISELGTQFALESKFPWDGRIRLVCNSSTEKKFTMKLRIPSWTDGVKLKLNEVPFDYVLPTQKELPSTLSGFDPRQASFLPVEHEWRGGDTLAIDFDMPIRVLHPHPKASGLRGRVAVTRGPLVYCLESIDNTMVDLFDCVIDANSLVCQSAPELFSGIAKINGKTTAGEVICFIPYALWGNRGPSRMNVWFRVK